MSSQAKEHFWCLFRYILWRHPILQDGVPPPSTSRIAPRSLTKSPPLPITLTRTPWPARVRPRPRLGPGTGGPVLKGTLLAHGTVRQGAIVRALPRLGFTRATAVMPVDSLTTEKRSHSEHGRGNKRDR